MEVSEHKKKDRYVFHILLFLASVITTTIAGAELTSGKSWYGWVPVETQKILSKLLLIFPVGDFAAMDWGDVQGGLVFSACFLTFLTVHEFGHYFAALYHKVKVSLPYYIPVFFPLVGMLNIGSFGAVIRLREIPKTTRKFFDIGIAGPLAGFVVSVVLLAWGFSHLPPLDDTIREIHPYYWEDFGGIPTADQFLNKAPAEAGLPMVGTSILFEILRFLFASDTAQIPPAFELMHYPFLFVGFLTLFFTALNLLPIGQLDGGHVIYGLFGPKISGIVSRLAVVALLFVGGTGMVQFEEMGDISWLGLYLMFLIYIFNRLYQSPQWQLPVFSAVSVFLTQALINMVFSGIEVSPIWLIYAFLAVRFIGVDHPPALKEEPLDRKRKILGYLAILIFILCFTPNPIYFLTKDPVVTSMLLP